MKNKGVGCIFVAVSGIGEMLAKLAVSLAFLAAAAMATAPVEGQCDGFNDYLTSLVSPDYPSHYPPATRREWTLEIPQGLQALVSINALEVERTWDYLRLEHIHHGAHGTHVTHFPLASGNVTSLILPEGNLTLDFCSDEFENFRGFAFDIRTRQTNNSLNRTCYEPNIEMFACDSGMQYIHAVSRCDGVIDCHDFSDEIGCGDCSPDSTRCEGTDICIRSEFLCDGVFDCPNQDDENCIDSKCPVDCVCGEGPYAHFFGPSRAFCAAPGYLPYWTNGTTTWNGEYAKNTTLRTVIVDLHDIPLGHLDPGSFDGMTSLNTLDLTNAALDHLPAGVFNGAPRLYKLYIRYNRLKYFEADTFRGLYNLELLFAEFNNLTRFDEGCFNGLTNLFFIDLENNGIQDFRPGTFRDLGGSLERLIITRNNLTAINSSLFYGLDNLLRVNMDNNELKYIEKGTFQNMTSLQDIVLASITTEPWTLYPDVFEGLDHLVSLHVNDPRLCCLAPESTECVLRVPPHPLFTCRKTFLQNTTIKVFIWILGISALIGNALVILLRLNTKPPNAVAQIQSMFITNLAAADFLMGVYMVYLAIMDVYIGESYFWEGLAAEWRSSTSCQVAGFISVLSSEASVFLLTLISIDRFICIIFPFTTKKLTVGSARLAIIVIWSVALLLSLIGVLLNNLYPDAYSLSDVCVGLPFIRKSTNLQASVDDRTTTTYQTLTYFTEATSSISTWQFSIVLFLGINFVGFFVILFTYIAIFVKVRFTRAEAGRTSQTKNDITMAIRMFLIVGTDFCCWMPIIIVGILVQTVGIEVSPNIYAWLVVFVLPINSSLNPYLYTIVHSYKQGATK